MFRGEHCLEWLGSGVAERRLTESRCLAEHWLSTMALGALILYYI